MQFFSLPVSNKFFYSKRLPQTFAANQNTFFIYIFFSYCLTNKYHRYSVFATAVIINHFYRLLRADGTFIYSSGAADNGIASLKPEEDSSTYQILAESRTDSAGGISYTVDGLTVTGTEYSAALDRQAQKPEAVWYEWNETNLNLLFGSVTARSNGES